MSAPSFARGTSSIARLADGEGVAWEDEVIGKRLTEAAQMLVLAPTGWGYRLNQLVEPGEPLRIRRRFLHR